MRISSIARKIKIKPSELISFCEKNGIELDSGAHSKLSTDQIESIYAEFAPEFLQQEVNPPALPEEEPPEINEESSEELVEPEIPKEAPTPIADKRTPEPIPEVEDISTDEPKVPIEEEIEVIRAPKVTLPGLKVKGKIDLPEPKKEEPKEEKQAEKNKLEKRSDRNRKRKKNGDDYNPIAAARKRRQEKEEKERNAALKRKKKAKAQHYYKIQKKVAKTKQVKETDAPEDKISFSNSRGKDIKGNILQRFWRWFNS